MVERTLTHVVVEVLAVVRGDESVTPGHEIHVQVTCPLEPHLLHADHSPLRYLPQPNTRYKTAAVAATAAAAAAVRPRVESRELLQRAAGPPPTRFRREEDKIGQE